MRTKRAFKNNDGKLYRPLTFAEIPIGSLIRYSSQPENVKRVTARCIKGLSVEYPYVKLETVSGNEYACGYNKYFISDMVTCILGVQISRDSGVTWEYARKEVKEAVSVMNLYHNH